MESWPFFLGLVYPMCCGFSPMFTVSSEMKKIKINKYKMTIIMITSGFSPVFTVSPEMKKKKEIHVNKYKMIMNLSF